MSENKRYYYLKLKDNFFDREEIKVLESLENGTTYSNLYLKLCLMSLKGEGKLFFRDEIPYDERMIASITNTNIDMVRAGIAIMQKLGLVKRVDSGEIFMADIQDMIGHSSSEGERKKAYRERLKNGQKLVGWDNVPNCPENRPPEIRDQSTEIRVQRKSTRPDNVEAVKQEIDRKKLNVDAHAFWDFYTKTEWHMTDGRPVKNWKLKLVSWHVANEKKQTPKKDIYAHLRKF